MNETSAGKVPSQLKERVLLGLRLLAIAGGLFYLGRLIWIVVFYSVDLIYRDAVAFYPSVWQRGWIDNFRWQHGPHRQGLGQVISKALFPITNGSMQAEAAILVIWVTIATVLAFLLVRRVAGKNHWHDCAMAFFMLSPALYFPLVRVPNTSHGAIPVALLLTSCFAVLIRNHWVRVPALVILSFVAAYTGYGLFVVASLIGYLGLITIRELIRRRYWMGLIHAITAVLCGVAASTFFIGYFPGQVEQLLTREGVHWFTYLQNAAFAFGRIAGFPGPTTGCAVAGWITMLLTLAIFAGHVIRALRGGELHPRSTWIIIILAFVLAFILNSAVGRVAFGPSNMTSARYATLGGVAAVGVYLHLIGITRCRLRVFALGIYLLVALFATAQMPRAYVDDMHQMADGKRRFISSYLKTGSVEQAQRLAKFKVYPDLQKARVEDRFRDMVKRRIGPFANASPATAPASVSQKIGPVSKPAVTRSTSRPATRSTTRPVR